MNQILPQTPQFDYPHGGMFSRDQRFGLAGEAWAANQLQSLGFDVMMLSQFFDDTDLLVNGNLPVEVKIARPTMHYRHAGSTGYRWQWNVSRGRVGHGDMILIAIAQDSAGQNWPFIIPSAQLQNRGNISITSHPTSYRGQWAANLNCWDWVGFMLQQSYKLAGQLALLPLWEVTHELSLL